MKETTNQLQKVISGGQTGVDRAALDAARLACLALGGWAPKGREAEDGVIPDRYPLDECGQGGYEERTRLNVRDSDANPVLLRDRPVGGTRLTIAQAARAGRPWRGYRRRLRQACDLRPGPPAPVRRAPGRGNLRPRGLRHDLGNVAPRAAKG